VSDNGRLSPAELAPIAQGQLRRDCAAAWNAMNVEARTLDCELLPNGSKSSYRTYAQQVELWQLYQQGKGALAAHPGSSNHGWGLAVDVATVEMRRMIDRIGEKYGWAKKWSDAPCVPLTTRILTRRGLVAYDELRPGDETVGFNRATRRAEWTAILDWDVYENARVVRYASSQLELVCTPRHRWLHERRDGRLDADTLDEMPLQHRLVLAAPGAEGDGLPLSVPECELLGWAMTDGSIYRFRNSQGRRAFARIYQRKPVGVAAIEATMTHFEHRRDDGYRTSGAPTTMWYVGRGVFSEILHRSQLDDLGPVRMVLAMTGEQRRAWFGAVRVAEGTQPEMRQVAQAVRPGNDAMREAIAVAGFLEGRRPALRARTVDLCNPRPFRNYLRAEPLDGTQTVWCPQTALGTWTADDGRSLVLTQNSEWWHLKWREGSYRGPDPGPYGTQPAELPPQVVYITPPPGGDVAQIAVMQNKDGRLEVFVLKDDGEVKHKWQKDPNQAFVDNWSSLGKP
jgi:D-alanyl-D-alanine carboxypeptidase